MAKEKKEKKEKAFHPQSRKAGQLERSLLRKSKLSDAASKKSKRTSAHSKSRSLAFINFFLKLQLL